MKSFTDRKTSYYWTDIILLALLAGFAFYVNRDIEIKGLYMDDLYMWSCYGEQSLVEFAFPIGTSTRFRPVYWLATYLQMMIVGTDMTRFVSFNIIINILTAVFYYHISRKLSGSRIMPFAVSLCYLASRFAYYQIGQALGLMETMAQLLAVAMLCSLYSFMNADGSLPGQNAVNAVRNGSTDSNSNVLTGRSRRRKGSGNSSEGSRSKTGYFAAALLIYFLTVFTHERYLSLFPLIYLALMINTVTCSARGLRLKAVREQIILWIAPLIELIAIIAIRCFAIGKAIPAGTGGTEVTETFGIGQAIGFCFDQVRYILGINAGPEYLNGLTWEDTPRRIKLLVLAGIAFLAAFVLIYLINLIYEIISDSRRSALSKDISAALMFPGFIALCIGCSSVTIRLEMRWIYVSYSAALLYASYMAGRIRGSALKSAEIAIRQKTGNAAAGDKRSAGIGKKAAYAFAVLCFIAYALISIYTNIFYRGYFTKLYLWPNQLRMNSLAEQTVEKYGIDWIKGKDIYILENTYEITDFNAQTFFKTYDPDRKAEGTTVIFADGYEDINIEDVAEGNALVLKEVPEENAYEDITEEFH